jgi:hypothetical protein
MNNKSTKEEYDNCAAHYTKTSPFLEFLLKPQFAF